MRKVTYLIDEKTQIIKVEEEQVLFNDLYKIVCCNLSTLIQANVNNPNFDINIFMNDILNNTMAINDSHGMLS